MPRPLLPEEDVLISELVDHFVQNREKFELFVEQLRAVLQGTQTLRQLVHSMKWRVKDAEHLRDKLIRRLVGADGGQPSFDVTRENLFERVNDLAGFRILHLHTRQMEAINKVLLDVLDEARYRVLEGPIAKTWDDETRAYFQEIGIQTESSESLYTSVYYVIEANTRTKYTGEIQVRTLAEELWGEVDHSINYPRACSVLACREQIKVLARVTSSCTRLVDAIFRTLEDDRERAKGDPDSI